MNMKVTLLHIYTKLVLISAFHAIALSVEKILDFPCVIVSLKLHNEILPAM